MPSWLCGSPLLAQPPAGVPVPSSGPAATAAAKGRRHRHPGGEGPCPWQGAGPWEPPEPARGPGRARVPSVVQVPPPTELRTPVPRTAAPAISGSPRGCGLTGAACAQHRVAMAAGGLSPQQSAVVWSPQLRSHPQAGAGRGEVAGTSRSGRTVSAAASSLCPNRAHPTPISAGGTPGCRERSGGCWQGGGVWPRMEGQLPADTHPLPPLPSWCHPAAGSLQGDTAELGGHQQPGGLPQYGLLQPQGQATAGRDARRGPGARAFPAASGDPRRAQPVSGAMLGLGFLSVSTGCRNSLSE